MAGKKKKATAPDTGPRSTGQALTAPREWLESAPASGVEEEIDPITVAVHEAGHAVAMLVHGWLFDRIYVVDPFGDGRPDGMATHRTGAVWVATLERKWENLVQALAGYIAEGLYDEWWMCGEILSPDDRADYRQVAVLFAGADGEAGPPEPVLPHLASAVLAGLDPWALPAEVPDDWVRAAHLAWALDGRTVGDHEAILRRAEAAAEALLVRRWGDVLRLADSLVRRQAGYMTYRQVCRLVGVAPRAAHPPGVADAAG
jgi:hypothetical protein